MTKKLFFGMSMFTLWLVACQTEEYPNHRDLTSYYFNEAKTKEGTVYEFQPVSDQRLPPFYWYHRTIQQQDTLFLLSTYYDYNYLPYQFAKEKLTEKGAILTDFNIYHTDTLSQKQRVVPVNIVSPNVFPFQVGKPNTAALVYHLTWTQPEDERTTVTLIRNRQYAGDTLWQFNNKALDAVKFNLRELIDTENQGHLEQEYGGMEIYAHNVGLVYFEKNISSDFVVAYALHDIYPMEDLEKRFSEVNSSTD